MSLFKRSNYEVAPICDRCGFPVKVATNALDQQRMGLAALVSERVCNQASLALGLVGHLEPRQTVPLAEAEGIALFHSCMVFALWRTWGKKEPIGAFLDLYMARLLSKIRERFGDMCSNQFQNILVSREVEFVKEFPKIETGDAALPEQGPVVKESGAATVRLAGRWVRRVEGTYDAELEKDGLHPASDVAALTALFHIVTTDIVADSRLFLSMKGLFQ
jgi:hypothetical protein